MSLFPYPVTRAFGIVDPAYSNYPNSAHPGTDYATGFNTPLPAKMSGTVKVYARGNTATGRGNEVVITNGDTQIKYCHLNNINVADGQTVTEGGTIGWSGYTGYVVPKSQAGSHLHFEVLINGVYTDPEKWKGKNTMLKSEAYTVVTGFYQWGTDAPPAPDLGEYWANRLSTVPNSVNELYDAMKKEAEKKETYVPYDGETLFKRKATK